MSVLILIGANFNHMKAIKREIKMLRGNEIEVRIDEDLLSLLYDYDKAIIFQCDFYNAGNKSTNAKFLEKYFPLSKKVWGYGYMSRGAPLNHVTGLIQVSELIRKIGL